MQVHLEQLDNQAHLDLKVIQDLPEILEPLETLDSKDNRDRAEMLVQRVPVDLKDPLEMLVKPVHLVLQVLQGLLDLLAQLDYRER